jgi:hypothetical protein
MPSTPSIAVIHYPEGVGHATRMVAIANALKTRGADVAVGGGGAGTEFAALNGYDVIEPTPVDFIDTYQDGSLWQTLRHSVPASLGRIADCQAWLTRTEPEAVITDDMFAAIAATRCDVPLYVLKHDMPALYGDPLERTGAGVHTLFQLSAAREFFYPVVWPGSEADPDRATRVPPVALEGTSAVQTAADVVVVPSHYSSLQQVTTHLRRQGYDVVNVAEDDWEAVPSLLPYIREANCVVCSGYSTIMDAAVAGTPCVIHPATDEQAAVADWIQQFDVPGFTVAPAPIDVLDAVAAPPDAPAFPNGATVIARRVLADVRDPDPYGRVESTPDATPTLGATGWTHRLRAVPALVGVGVVAAGSLVRPRRVSGHVHAASRRLGRTLRRGLARTARLTQRASRAGRRHLTTAVTRGYTAARRLGRRVTALS